MPYLEDRTLIAAPIERVYHLTRSIDLFQHALKGYGTHAVAGRRSGLLNEHEEVHWASRHLGLNLRLVSQCVEGRLPHVFTVQRSGGVFPRMEHKHIFIEQSGLEGGTLMVNQFSYGAPFGALGAFANPLFLKKYIYKLLQLKNSVIKRVAEGDTWRDFLPEALSVPTSSNGRAANDERQPAAQ